MTREEIELTIDYLKNIQKEYTIVGENDGYTYPLPEWYALDNAIKALEQKPYEKFKSTKDHIYKLAGDYKCWDNRLTQDEALELCHILEQEPRWIPCSERMPKEEKKPYWICTDYGYQCECRWTNVNPFWTDLTTDWHWHHMDVPQYSKVVAWMQLPEPYKAESEG